jgi:hypothetical protein
VCFPPFRAISGNYTVYTPNLLVRRRGRHDNERGRKIEKTIKKGKRGSKEIQREEWRKEEKKVELGIGNRYRYDIGQKGRNRLTDISVSVSTQKPRYSDILLGTLLLYI